MAEYVKKSDVIKIMENNSHMIEVFGVKKKMIDAFAMCCDFADLETVSIEEDDLEKQIPCKPEEYVPDFPYNIFSTQKCAKCGTPVIGKKISKYCFECGQKIDWGEE